MYYGYYGATFKDLAVYNNNLLICNSSLQLDESPYDDISFEEYLFNNYC